MKSAHRPRALYIGLLLTTIALGLATRRFPGAFPAVVAEFGGDTLWATMVYWSLALSFRAADEKHLAMGALFVAYAVEISQLYRAPWISAIRSTTLGALVLGQGFLWSDLLSYLVGIVLAVVIDTRITRRHAAASP